MTRFRSLGVAAILVFWACPLPGPTPSRSAAAEESEKGSPAKPAPGVSLAEFKELKPILDIKNQPWATIPWKYSITEARKQAAASQKPIFMVVNTGNALGCT